MREIRTSGLTSGDGKRGVAAWPKPPRPSSTLQVKGRKRHILTDTDGRLLTIQVHGANIQDRDGAKGVLKRSRARFPFVQHAYVDGGYAGRLVRWAKDKGHIVLDVVKRSAKQTGFAVIRRRWVVGRTSAWIVKNRRLVRDYEQLIRFRA